MITKLTGGCYSINIRYKNSSAPSLLFTAIAIEIDDIFLMCEEV